jgi:hypothetical protein
MVLKSISNGSVWHFLYNFFSGTFHSEIFRDLRRHTEVPKVNISEFVSL